MDRKTHHRFFRPELQMQHNSSPNHSHVICAHHKHPLKLIFKGKAVTWNKILNQSFWTVFDFKIYYTLVTVTKTI